MARKIVPVTPQGPNRYIAPAAVLAVFDTNGAGELIEVPFRRNPADAIEFHPTHTPTGQIWAEIVTEYKGKHRA